jgi:hypothetical protein
MTYQKKPASGRYTEADSNNADAIISFLARFSLISSFASAVKKSIMWLVMRGLISGHFAEWLIRHGGLKHA